MSDFKEFLDKVLAPIRGEAQRLRGLQRRISVADSYALALARAEGSTLPADAVTLRIDSRSEALAWLYLWSGHRCGVFITAHKPLEARQSQEANDDAHPRKTLPRSKRRLYLAALLPVLGITVLVA